MPSRRKYAYVYYNGKLYRKYMVCTLLCTFRFTMYSPACMGKGHFTQTFFSEMISSKNSLKHCISLNLNYSLPKAKKKTFEIYFNVHFFWES